MDPAAVAAGCAAILGAVAVLTRMFRAFRKVSRAADLWATISHEFTPSADGRSIPQRLDRLEDSVADLTAGAHGR